MQHWALGLVVLPLALTIFVGVADSGRLGEHLIWRDEFDQLDLKVWNHLVTAWRGGNKEFQYYRNSRKNSYIRDGILYLRPTLTADEHGKDFLYTGNITESDCNYKPCSSVANKDIVLPIQSSRIRTINSFSFRYGRLEIRAQMPRGDWIWPAIWLKPKENYYGSWPASGEIDLVETRGNRKIQNSKGESEGIDRMGSTLHVGYNSSYNIWRPTHWTKTLGKPKDFASDFHIYEMVWSKTCILFKVDGEIIGKQPAPEGGFYKLGGLDKVPGGQNIWKDGEPMAPFDREFFIILNVAVGGTFFSDGNRYLPYGKPWNWSSPHPMKDFWDAKDKWYPTWEGESAAMKIDYVRVYSNAPGADKCN
ncbi:beta-1,3-glucan-binding protein [Anabrus simplex]|uniref:beta-1,3-glucan-binding protein n=1 Tax=Anabrus simplex TaxID=316456 RepID=UPI0034DD50CF